MNLNTVLAIIIVLIFLLGFILWFSVTGLVLFASPSEAMRLFIPGAIFFGFWLGVAWRLYNCPAPQ